MKLIDNKSELHKFWSVWASAMAALFSLLEVLSQMTDVLPLLNGVLPPKTFLALSLLCAVAAPILRAIKQPGLHDEPTN